MAGDTSLEDQAMQDLIDEACSAFEQDYRYAEAMAKQAAALRARRAPRLRVA